MTKLVGFVLLSFTFLQVAVSPYTPGQFLKKIAFSSMIFSLGNLSYMHKFHDGNIEFLNYLTVERYYRKIMIFHCKILPIVEAANLTVGLFTIVFD